MALLPPQFLNSVVAIGTKTDDASQTHWIGTGFIYGADADGSGSEVYPFLATNQHVLEGDGIVVVKINRKDDLPAGEYRFNLESVRHDITEHPDGLDVAVLPIAADVWNEYRTAASYVTNEHSLSLAKAGEIGVYEGDGVFAAGFPLSMVGYEDQIFPIVKQGCIARIQDWLSGRTRSILIDANIFPGNSGGPVFLRPSLSAIEGTHSNSYSYLIGMVSRVVIYEDKAFSTRTGRERITFEENSGIAEIVPSDVIMETIQIAMQRLEQTD